MASLSAKITIFFLKMATKNLIPPNYSTEIFKFVSVKKKYRIPNKFDYYTEKCTTGAEIEFIKHKGSNPCKVVYLLHGGAYILPQQDTYRKYAVRMLKECGDILVALLDYRVVPNKYPTAVDDALSGYDYLLDKGYLDEDIILHGDSAGGNLSLALSLKLKELSRSLPKAMFLLSPWADMTMSGDSYYHNHAKDAFFGCNKPMTDKRREIYLTSDMFSYFEGANREDPLISPIFADYKGFMDTYIVVGSDEMLLSDSVTVSEKMRDSGVAVEIDIVDSMFHVFPLFPYFDEAKKAQKDIFTRIKKYL